jgi:tetratricopeptide (TPR) repeat protein
MLTLILMLASAAAAAPPEVEKARDRQDRAALERALAEFSAAAEKQPAGAQAQYTAALAASYLAEIALELRDKAGAQRAAETGIRFAERAVALEPNQAEYHRILGTLCGQVIPANVLAGLRYGKRAQEEVARAIELDPKSSRAYLSRAVGNYYLPPPLGPGIEASIRDIRKAIELDPRNAEAYLWLGLALRKSQKNAEARQAFAKALELNPGRVWAKQQLEKTPAR